MASRKTIGDHAAIIAVDIDGTLNDGDEKVPMLNRKPNGRLEELLLALGLRGYTIILYTSRDIARRRETIEWLHSNGFIDGRHYYDIVFNKLKYDYIIDDRSFNPKYPIADDIPKEVDEISELLEFYLG